MRKSFVVGGFAAFALLLVPGLAPARLDLTAPPERGTAPPAAGVPIKPFVIHGVFTREQRSQLMAEGYDIGEGYWPDHVDLFATDAQALALSLRGFRVVPGEQRDDFPPPDSNYHNYDEMVADMQALAAAYPSKVHLFSLGTSYEGKNIIGARVSNDATDNLSEPGVFYVGQHHAREHMSVEVVLSLMHRFVEKPMVGNLINTRQIYFVPSLNPDGSEYDIATGQYRYWRKNRQPDQGIYGTDPNRNYSYKWGCCGGSSGNRSSETYRGAYPLSAPENARMSDFILAHPNITTGISYHSYGDLILYPYGYTYEDVPPDMTQVDHQTFVAIGAKMAATTNYTPQQSSDLYITDGDWNDWMYGGQQRYPITIELSGYGYGFYPPDEYIPQETVKNHQAAIFLAQIADCPTKIVGVAC